MVPYGSFWQNNEILPFPPLEIQSTDKHAEHSLISQFITKYTITWHARLGVGRFSVISTIYLQRTQKPWTEW